MKYFAIIFYGLFLMSCSLLQPRQRVLVLREDWTRQTFKDPYLKYRLSHQMAPIVHGDLVLQGNAIDGFSIYKKNEGNLLWKIPVDNGVSGGAQVYEDKVYFGGSDGQFYCVDLLSGKLIWTFPTRVENLAAPLVDGGTVYFLSGNDTVFALDALNGKQKWVYTRNNTSELSVRGGTKPLIHNNILYLGFADGFFAALHVKDGSVAWERQLNLNPKFRDVDSSPVIDGNMIYVAGYDEALYALNRSDGQVLWRKEDGAADAVTIDGNTLYYASTSGKVLALKKSSGSTLWERPAKGMATRPKVYKEFLVYGETDGALKVVEKLTGKDVKEFYSGYGVNSAPTIDPNSQRIFFISNQGNLFSLLLRWERQETFGEKIRL